MKQRHIQHLYWRAGFGIGVKKIDQLKSKSKNEIIKDLFQAFLELMAKPSNYRVV